MFTIKSGVPIPKGNGGRKVQHHFPLADMAKGDSFFIPNAYWNAGLPLSPRAVRQRAQNIFRGWRERTNRTESFLVLGATEDGVVGVRVWRK